MRHCAIHQHTPCATKTKHWFYITGHLVDTSIKAINNSPISCIPDDHVELAIQQWNNVHQELISKFGIPESLAGRLRDHISVVLDGSTVENFLYAWNQKMCQPGPMNFIQGAQHWLVHNAACLLNTLPVKVKSEMVVFNENTEFETNFTMRDKIQILLDELQKLICFTWGSTPVSSFQNINAPSHVPRYLYALVSQPTMNNLFTLPVLCKFLIYRSFHIKGESIEDSKRSMRFRGASACSSTAATHLHLSRLGSLCFLATFCGPNYQFHQLRVCK